MPKPPVRDYRRAYMAQFAAMDSRARLAVIEALGVIHDIMSARETPRDAPDEPLLPDDQEPT